MHGPLVSTTEEVLTANRGPSVAAPGTDLQAVELFWSERRLFENLSEGPVGYIAGMHGHVSQPAVSVPQHFMRSALTDFHEAGFE